MWDFNIQYYNIIEHRRTDIVTAEKKQNRCVIVDIVSLGKLRVHENEQEKIDNYQDFDRNFVVLKDQASRNSACSSW